MEKLYQVSSWGPDGQDDVVCLVQGGSFTETAALLETDHTASSFRGQCSGLANSVSVDAVLQLLDHVLLIAPPVGQARDLLRRVGAVDREIPCATSYVEHMLTVLEGLPRHEFLGDIFDSAGDATEVAGLPRRLLPGFDGCQVWNGGGIEMAVPVLSGV